MSLFDDLNDFIKRNSNVHVVGKQADVSAEYEDSIEFEDKSGESIFLFQV